ncbi:MAG: HEPN domain-containing protein [Treponema sp.]|nr:HEPN domain-containing protein [Treponema sp.]
MSDIKLVHEWLKYSQNDLISAKHLYDDLHPKQTEVACYLSQQCAEKALKGYILYKDVEPPKTHNLVELCQICMIHDNSFEDLLDTCADLTPYGIAVRYPNELAVDDTITKLAIGKAQVVYDFCVGKIPRATRI